MQTPSVTIPPSPAETPGPPVAAPPATAAEMYEALRNFRGELERQLSSLENKRDELIARLREAPGPTSRTGMEQRLAEVDRQILETHKQLATANSQVAAAAGVPGAIEPTAPESIHPELIIVPTVMTLLVMLPIVIAWSRRLWKRADRRVIAFPPDLGERISRLEHGVEATGIEVERIAEGQRFLTSLFTEGAGARVIRQSGAARLGPMPGDPGAR